MKALNRIDAQLARTQKKMEGLRRKRLALARKEAKRKAESYKLLPAYQNLERQHREVRARIHVIRVNINKKNWSIKFKTRDLVNLAAAIKQFKNEEKHQTKKLRVIVGRMAAFERR